MQFKSAEQMAITHMSQEIVNYIEYGNGMPEVYTVAPTTLATKFNRRLNRMLGLHKLNMNRHQ